MNTRALCVQGWRSQNRCTFSRLLYITDTRGKTQSLKQTSLCDHLGYLRLGSFCLWPHFDCSSQKSLNPPPLVSGILSRKTSQPPAASVARRPIDHAANLHWVICSPFCLLACLVDQHYITILWGKRLQREIKNHVLLPPTDVAKTLNGQPFRLLSLYSLSSTHFLLSLFFTTFKSFHIFYIYSPLMKMELTGESMTLFHESLTIHCHDACPFS